MIEDFVKDLLKRNKYLGLPLVAVVLIAAIVDIVNNLLGLGVLLPLYSRPLLIVALLSLLVAVISIVRESKGFYSFQQRRLARISIVILCLIVVYFIWLELETRFTFPAKYRVITPGLYAVGGLIGLVWFIWADIKDRRPPPEFTILVCEFSEGARKEIPKDRHITHYVLQSLRQKVTSERVKIVHVEEVILDHDRAATLGRNAKAVAVLFGLFTKLPTNILLDIKFQVIRKPQFYNPIDVERRTIPIDELDRGRLQVFLERDFASITNFLIGLFEYSAENYSQAVQHFQWALTDVEEGEPNSHDYSLGLDVLHLYLGNSLHMAGDYDGAKREFEIAISLNDASAKALHNLGVSLHREKNRERAVEYFSKAIEADPNLWVAYRNRAFVLMEMRRYSEAEKYLAHYLNLQPNDVEAIRLHAICCSVVGDSQGAIEKYESLLEIEPKRHSERFSLAKEYIKAGNQEAAERILISLARRGEYASRAYGLLGDQSFQQKDFPKAVNYFTKALGHDKNNSHLFFARGSAYFALQDLGLAAKDFHKAAILDPSMVDAHYNLGNVCLKAGMPKLAVESYSKAIEVEPEFSEALFNRAQAFLGLGMFQKVIEDCKKFIEYTGDPKGKGFALSAMAKLQVGDYLGAIADFDEAFLHNPDSKQFKLALAKAHLSYACHLIKHGADRATVLKHYYQAKEMDPSLKAEVECEEKVQGVTNRISDTKATDEIQ